MSELEKEIVDSAEVKESKNFIEHREIETLDLENGDIADYRTTAQGIELEVLDAEEKRLATLNMNTLKG